MVSEKKFAICHNKGWHMRFKNGWTISVQFGPGNYCDNYNAPFTAYKNMGKESAQSDTAEVWCFKEGVGNYPEEPTNNSTPEEVLRIMNKVKKFTKKDDADYTEGVKDEN